MVGIVMPAVYGLLVFFLWLSWGCKDWTMISAKIRARMVATEGGRSGGGGGGGGKGTKNFQLRKGTAMPWVAHHVRLPVNQQRTPDASQHSVICHVVARPRGQHSIDTGVCVFLVAC